MTTPKYLLCPPPCGNTLSEETVVGQGHRYHCVKCGYSRTGRA